MFVVPLLSASSPELVGGKAARLGELIRQGEQVPDGFCVTTEAHRRGVLPTAEIIAAYELLGAGPVAIRSSATAEDRPDAAFAGQHDTFLDVTGVEEVLAAILKCWDSLHSARAVAYRAARGLPSGAVLMAVVVQRMVDASVSGVLFTANPLTGCRTEMLVDAAPGLGTAVVDGGADVDHYVLDGSDSVDGSRTGGCLSGERPAELRALGGRLQELAGSPQDVEWSFDGDGALWILQSRPITTLFPAPPVLPGPLPRIYLEFGHVQGMLQPVTPMGMATLQRTIAAMAAAIGLRVEVVDIGGRLYGDLTDLARHRTARKRLVKLMAVDFGPRAQAVMRHILDDPRFAPDGSARPGRGSASTGAAVRAVTGILRALARPEAARLRMARAVERLRVDSAAPVGLRTTADRLRFLRAEAPAGGADAITWPIVAGLLASALPGQLLKGVAEPAEIHTALGGMPHNVTIEMDLALWRLARDAEEHHALLLGTPPAELAGRYLRGDLPDLGLAGFLERYGHRGPAEADVGVPRWAEDPAPLFAAIANYLRVTDPAQAPDVRFARAAETAEATLRELVVRAERRRPVRGRFAGFLLGRARRLAGLRETGKFAGLYRLRAERDQLLLIGGDLTDAGLLTDPADIMFLTLDEVEAALGPDAARPGADQPGSGIRAIVAGRKAVHVAEMRRRVVPVALLSDGTDVERLLATADDAAGVLQGVGASAGRVTGPARVVHDPATAHLEPGDILVTATTDPGWTPLFLTAAALVTETGAIMAHGPTVAREYGLPAVISVPGATRRIVTGQVITVDGAAGTVAVL